MTIHTSWPFLSKYTSLKVTPEIGCVDHTGCLQSSYTEEWDDKGRGDSLCQELSTLRGGSRRRHRRLVRNMGDGIDGHEKEYSEKNGFSDGLQQQDITRLRTPP